MFSTTRSSNKLTNLVCMMNHVCLASRISIRPERTGDDDDDNVLYLHRKHGRASDLQLGKHLGRHLPWLPSRWSRSPAKASPSRPQGAGFLQRRRVLLLLLELCRAEVRFGQRCHTSTALSSSMTAWGEGRGELNGVSDMGEDATYLVSGRAAGPTLGIPRVDFRKPERKNRIIGANTEQLNVNVT